MRLLWNIMYIDKRDKKKKNRLLELNTECLEPAEKAAVEATYELNDAGSNWDMLKYRHLFTEEKHQETASDNEGFPRSRGGTVFIRDYFEDENCNPMTLNEVGQVLTGKKNIVMIPPGLKQYDLDYIFSAKKPIPYDAIQLSDDQLRSLGYFVRDFRELINSAFYREGSGSLIYHSNGQYRLETAVSKEEIADFIQVFRRLYMKKHEPGNFLKAVDVLINALQDNPIARRVAAIAKVYSNELQQCPDTRTFLIRKKVSFNRKRLIDVFFYTQYAHQPDEKRERQFNDCLAAVENNSIVLKWLFLKEIWLSAVHIHNAGIEILKFYESYCKSHQKQADIIESVGKSYPGIGVGEKKEAKRERILREKAEELALEIWERSGCPQGGSVQFLRDAQEQLIAAMDDTEN